MLESSAYTADTRKPITKVLVALQWLKTSSKSANNRCHLREASGGCVVESGPLSESSHKSVGQKPH